MRDWWQARHSMRWLFLLSPFVALFANLSACSSRDAGDAPISGSAEGGADAPAEAASDATISSALDAAGLTSTSGRFGFLDLSQCCSQPTCFGNNPSSPYAGIYLGRGAGQTAPNPGEGS